MAMLAPPEEHAYVVLLNPDGNGRPDALAVMDVNSTSSTYQQVVGRVELGAGDEVHHFGWNACSAALCPYAPHPHVERRYLLVPGLKSSRIHVIDTKPDPARPTIVKVIEADELHERTGYSRPHTFHCGPDAIYVSALGAPDGNGPGGIFVMDHDTFEPLGRWEVERGPQRLAYDFWWHLGYDTMVTSEWGTPNMIEGGLNPEILMQSGYGHQMHVWDLRRRKHLQALDLGEEYQILLELRPAHDPSKAYGFAGAVICLKDLSASIWLWHREDSGAWAIRKVIDIPAEPADPDLLPPILKGFGEVPPLATDLNLSLDDKFLYVSCWGTGELSCRCHPCGGSSPGRAGRGPDGSAQVPRSGSAHPLRPLQAHPAQAPALGRDAGRLQGLDGVVVHHGQRARGGPHARPRAARAHRYDAGDGTPGARGS
jgi:selenium-binding protein 1